MGMSDDEDDDEGTLAWQYLQYQPTTTQLAQDVRLLANALYTRNMCVRSVGEITSIPYQKFLHTNLVWFIHVPWP